MWIHAGIHKTLSDSCGNFRGAVSQRFIERWVLLLKYLCCRGQHCGLQLADGVLKQVHSVLTMAGQLFQPLTCKIKLFQRQNWTRSFVYRLLHLSFSWSRVCKCLLLWIFVYSYKWKWGRFSHHSEADPAAVGIRESAIKLCGKLSDVHMLMERFHGC